MVGDGRVREVSGIRVCCSGSNSVIAHPPPICQVRDKMLYAATKATVKKSFQSGVVIDDIAATSKVPTYTQTYSVFLHPPPPPPPPPPLSRPEFHIKLFSVVLPPLLLWGNTQIINHGLHTY